MIMITNHAVQRYRERFNPFVSVIECREYILNRFENSQKVTDDSVYKLSDDADFYLDTDMIFVVREDTIVTTYPTAISKESYNTMDLNKIYIAINELRKLLEDYKGHKPKQLRELEEFLKRPAVKP